MRRRGLPHRPLRPPGPGADRPAQGRAVRRCHRSCRRTCRCRRSTTCLHRRMPSLHAALALISQAQRPVVYGGGGIALARCGAGVPHLRRCHPDPDRADAEGPGRAADRRIRSTSACSACTAAARANLAVQEARPADRASARASTTAPPASWPSSHRTRASSTWTWTPARSASCATPTSACAATSAPR